MILRPATVYGPRSVEMVGEMGRAINGRYMLLVDRGRAVAGLVYVENLVDAALLALRHEAAPGQAFNVTDGLDVTWRQFTDGLAAGLGAPPVRLTLPYGAAHGLGRTLEGGYRMLRRATPLDVPPLLSRAAVDLLESRSDPDSWINPETSFDTVHHTFDLRFAITWRHAWAPLRLLPRR